jgi:hypothetical protein
MDEIRFPYFSHTMKKGRQQSSQALDFQSNFGGKCKFRTCDPCSVKVILPGRLALLKSYVVENIT